jgi:tetratricopeptide (TPR) repeat protein
MFKSRLRQWGFVKNLSSNDWHALAKLYKARRDSGKQATEFLINGRRKTIADLQKHIRSLSQKPSEEEFLAAAESMTVPPHMRSYTPDPGGTPNSLSSSTESISSTLHFTPISSKIPLSYPRSSSMKDRPLHKEDGTAPIPSTASPRHPTTEAALQQESVTNEDYVFISNISEAASEALSSPSSCDQVQQDVRTMALQVVKPVPLMSRYGAEDIRSWVLVSSTEATEGAQDNGTLCPQCTQAMSEHCISLEGLAPSNQQPRSLLCSAAQEAMILPSTTEGRGEAWRWMAFCFGACIHMSRGDTELSTKLLASAAEELEEMLSKYDPLTLMSLNLMLSILHMHDQGSIAERIVRSAFEVAQRVLSVDDGIRVTIEWMVTVAGRTLQKGGEVLVKLERIHQAFDTTLGTSSPTTIASLYNVAWMLCCEGRWQEAEETLQDLYERSSASLGTMHLQSTMALATLSRAQSRQGKYTAAINTIKLSIRDSVSTLGRSHPYRLELKRRLALMYQDIGKKELMEDLYWDVLKGRIKMLGTEHPYTAGAKADVEELLKELGQWNEDGSTQSSIDQLFINTSPVCVSYEAY